MLTKKSQKVAHFFTCHNCDYNTSKKSDYEKHCKTEKHKVATLATKINGLSTEMSQMSQKFPYECQCGLTYKDRSGLWRHKKKCDFQQPNNSFPNNSNEQIKLITDVVVQVMKNGTNITNNHTTQNHNKSHNTTHNNSHNKTFNLNFFLNETCKDAIDINDFVKNIKVQLEDLEHTGRQGYVEGVTNIILKNLNYITTHSRPIHCTDEKREVIYIKNEGEWIKETENKIILTNAIKTIANENIKQISQWAKLYPDCTQSDSNKNDLYLQIVSNSMSGGTKEECEKNYNKIIKNIVKQTIIDKENNN